jgi:hypothetical protein
LSRVLVRSPFRRCGMTDKVKTVRFWQEIVLTLAFKALVLVIIWAVWFSAPQDINLDDQAVASKILSQQPQQEHNHDAVPRAR